MGGQGRMHIHVQPLKELSSTQGAWQLLISRTHNSTSHIAQAIWLADVMHAANSKIQEDHANRLRFSVHPWPFRMPLPFCRCLCSAHSLPFYHCFSTSSCRAIIDQVQQMIHRATASSGIALPPARGLVPYCSIPTRGDTPRNTNIHVTNSELLHPSAT